MKKTQKRVMARNDFYALQFASLMFGGIGRGGYYVGGGDSGQEPVCGIGCLHAAKTPEVGVGATEHALEQMLGMTFIESDAVVLRVNERRGRPADSRITFEEYIREGNIQPRTA